MMISCIKIQYLLYSTLTRNYMPHTNTQNENTSTLNEVINTVTIIYTQHTVHLKGHRMDNFMAHSVPHLPMVPQEGWGLRTACRGGGDKNHRTLFPSWSFSSLCPWWSVILWACKCYGLPSITSGRGLRWTKVENINIINWEFTGQN